MGDFDEGRSVMSKEVIYAILFVVLTGCSDVYRYPCQDPENQAKAHCTPPECVADSTCTDYLVETHK